MADAEEAALIADFYDEYFAVLDIAAEFYLETIDRVFQRELLAQGQFTWRGRLVEPAAIRRTALLTVEGEKDDVCGVGQTLAAQDLCTGIKPAKKRHHLQPGVGHYGVFSGSRWERQIYPIVRNFILANVRRVEPAARTPSRVPRRRRARAGPLHPLDHLGHGQHGLDVVSGHGARLDVVGPEPGAHRRVHGVGHGALGPEEERAARGGQAVVPEDLDAVDVGLGAGPDGKSRVVGLDVHREGRAQVGEARVDLARHRPAPRLRLASSGRSEPSEILVEVLADGQGVPDHEVVVFAAAAPGTRGRAGAARPGRPDRGCRRPRRRSPARRTCTTTNPGATRRRSCGC